VLSEFSACHYNTQNNDDQFLINKTLEVNEKR
jgi:hypothetical protein